MDVDSQTSRDYQEVITHTTIKGIQTMSILTPPILLISAIRGKNFSPARFLRRNAISTFLLGAPIGFGLGYGRMRDMAPDGVSDRAYRLKFNAGQVKCDDFTKTGFVLGALLTTIIFYRRTSIITALAGGASLGVGGGVLTHLVVNTSQEGSKPNAMIEELKSSYPLKKDVEQIQAGDGQKVVDGR